MTLAVNSMFTLGVSYNMLDCLLVCQQCTCATHVDQCAAHVHCGCSFFAPHTNLLVTKTNTTVHVMGGRVEGRAYC